MQDDTWQEYLEAFQTSARVGDLQGQALVRAVEQRDRTVDELRAAEAQQQAMFDLARTEANELRNRLTVLHESLGIVPALIVPPAGSPRGRTPQQIRRSLVGIRDWADEAAVRHASLSRSLARLERAEQSTRMSARQPMATNDKGCALLAASALTICLAALAAILLLS